MGEEKNKPFPPVWDENNRLVDPEAEAYYKSERNRVLGLDADGKPIPQEERLLKEPDLDKIKESQESESQTADPLTSPQAVTDRNTLPYVPTNAAPVPGVTSETRRVRPAAPLNPPDAPVAPVTPKTE